MIAIIDYGMGNLASVCKALEYIGQEAAITSDPDKLHMAKAVILPGVGAMRDAMENLAKSKLQQSIINYVDSGKPFLGICLGMQMLFDFSDEGYDRNGDKVRGLGIIKGNVLRLPNVESLKIPHMGWNQLAQTRDDILPIDKSVYFVHSYHASPEDPGIITSKAFHGQEFVASIRQGNVRATQFHPEKSGEIGIEILRKWAKTVDEQS